MKLGSLQLQLIGDGFFRLDGGAMFGVVPRVLWEKKKPPDEENRIHMATNCPLIERGADLVLVDSGIGDKNDAKFRHIFGLEEGAARLPDQLRARGYEPGDVTHVITTHLHFDHCGWHTREQGGKLVPTFPEARYFIERGELEHARRPNPRDRASYDARNWEPLFEAGVVEVFDDEIEPVPGIRAVKARGHNADMCIVLLDGGDGEKDVAEEGDGEKGVFWADLVPTVAHLPYPWVMGYDLYPLETLANKEKWLPRAAAENWLCLFEHEDETPIGRLVEERPGRFGLQAVSDERP